MNARTRGVRSRRLLTTAGPPRHLGSTHHAAAREPDAHQLIDNNLRLPGVGSATAQAAALSRATGGRPSRGRGALTLLQLQRAYGNRHVQRVIRHARGSAEGRRAPANRSGLPDGLRTRLERRTGLDLSDIKVHYNSSRPAQLDALAYTQGREIHVGPGQERCLPHEAWHVVQQMQGRVQATTTENGVALNDDSALEREADMVGRASHATSPPSARGPQGGHEAHPSGQLPPIQRHKKQVNDLLKRYRNGKPLLSASDEQKVFEVFAAWEHLMKQADKLRRAKGAGELRKKAEKVISKTMIEDLATKEGLSTGVKNALIRQWNHRQRNDDKVDLVVPPLVPFTRAVGGKSSLKRQHSELAESFSVSDDLPGPPPSKRMRIDLQKANKEKESVGVTSDIGEAALTIRSLEKKGLGIPHNFRLAWVTNDKAGLFERRSQEDIVYTNLRNIGPKTWVRAGKVDNWDKILDNVPDAYMNDPKRFLHELQSVFRGGKTSSDEMMLVAGAMLSDVKHSINIWIDLLSELYPLLKKNPGDYEPGEFRKIFTEWYEYIRARKQGPRELAKSYRAQPNRVRSDEWNVPTLIPRRGGFHFHDAAEPGDNLALRALRFDVSDPRDLWGLALTNKYLYNMLAAKLRASRKPLV